jgi:outer membrane protein assembly factor BamB
MMKIPIVLLGMVVCFAFSQNDMKPEIVTFDSGRTGWRLQIPGNRPLATVAYDDGLIFVGGGYGSYEFYAVNAQTGEIAWVFKTGDDGPTAAVVRRGYVVFNTESCIIYVLRARTGEKVWEKWLGDPLMSQPALDD